MRARRAIVAAFVAVLVCELVRARAAIPGGVLVALPWWIFTACVAGCAFGLGHRSLRVKVAARGVMWLFFVTAGFVAWTAPVSRFTAWALLGGTVLVLSRAWLHDEASVRSFMPNAFRRTWLSACVASVAVGALVAIRVASIILAVALRARVEPHIAGRAVPEGLLGFALCVGFFGAAVGVLRMRAWGVLLGALASLVSVVVLATGWTDLTALACHPGWSPMFVAALAAVPGIAFVLPVVVSRRQLERVHVLDEVLHGIDRRLGEDSVTEVEHVAGLALHAPKDVRRA
jgi:hypothetical protein